MFYGRDTGGISVYLVAFLQITIAIASTATIATRDWLFTKIKFSIDWADLPLDLDCSQYLLVRCASVPTASIISGECLMMQREVANTG